MLFFLLLISCFFDVFFSSLSFLLYKKKRTSHCSTIITNGEAATGTYIFPPQWQRCQGQHGWQCCSSHHNIQSVCTKTTTTKINTNETANWTLVMLFSTLRCKQSVDSHSKQNCNFRINSHITLKMGKGHKNLAWIGYRQISTQAMFTIKCESFLKVHRRLKRTCILIRKDSIYTTLLWRH